MRKIIFTVITLLLVPFCLAGSLTISLEKSYTIPKIIEPNSEATIYLYLANTNSQSSITDIDIKVSSDSCIEIENQNFEINYIGPLSSYMIPIKIRTTNCKISAYSLEIKAEYYENGNYYEDVLYYPIIITEYPKLEVSNILLNKVRDDIYELRIYLKNQGISKLRNIELYLNSTTCASILDSNHLNIGDLDSESETYGEILIKINSNFDTCSIPITLIYNDWLGNKYVSTRIISFLVPIEEPEISVKLNTYDPSKSEIEIIVMNLGEQSVRDLYLELIETRDYEIIDKRIEFIGDLDPNDYELVSFKIKPLREKLDLKLNVFYKNKRGQKYEKVYEFPLEIETKEEIPLEYYYLVLSLVVLFIILIIAKKKRKKNENI